MSTKSVGQIGTNAQNGIAVHPSLPFATPGLSPTEQRCAGRSQKARLLATLKEGRRLSPLDALRLFGCFRLAARISELRAEGYPIQSEICQGHAVYFLPRAGR